MKCHLVFVYGTLRKHQVNNHLLKNAERIASQSWAYGRLYDVGFGYPAMIQGEDSKVYGELYRVNDQGLRRLDLLEGYKGPGLDSNHYERLEQEVYTDFGTYEAYIYVYRKEQVNGLREVQTGDWKCETLLGKSPLNYFAYGSCMDNHRLKEHGVEKYFMTIMGKGELEYYQLAYTIKEKDGGRADIIEGSGLVEGKVYQIGEEALSYLNKREGAHINKYRPTFIDVLVNGELLIDVLTYVVVDKKEETAPPLIYAEEIIRGAKGYLSSSYIKGLEDHLLNKFGMKV